MIILAQVNSEKKRQNGSKRIAIGNKMGVIRKHAAHSPILSDLKTIYQAALDRVTEKWSPKYPNSMKRWKDNWMLFLQFLNFQPLSEGHLYNKCDRITELHIPETESSEKRISK